MQKQAVLQVTRWKLPEMKRPGRPVEGRGYLELDLVEAKGRDIGKFVHHPVKDFYWITLVDRLTGWLVIQRTVHKDVASVAPKLRGMLRKMARALKTDIKYIRSDSGSEFKSDTQAVFKELKIRHKFVKSGNRVEQANRTFQKIWYRLMRLGRGDLAELDVQATAIFNNTKSGVSGFTPEEALGQPDQTLKAASKAAKDKRKIPKYSAVLIKVGDKVRYQMKDIVGKHGKALAYKSYRGKQWSADVYPVVKYNKHEEIGAEGEKQPGTGKYYVGGTWRFRDKLLLVPGVDATTRAMVTARHTQKKKDWQDEIGDMAL